MYTPPQPDWELAGAIQRAEKRHHKGLNEGTVPHAEMVRLGYVVNYFRHHRLTREEAIAEANQLAPASE